MFGPGIRNVFRSRWHALFWSGSMLLTAYCSVPAPDDAGQDDKGLEGGAAKVAAKPPHKNPWAKDSAAN